VAARLPIMQRPPPRPARDDITRAVGWGPVFFPSARELIVRSHPSLPPILPQTERVEHRPGSPRNATAAEVLSVDPRVALHRVVGDGDVEAASAGYNTAQAVAPPARRWRRTRR
jgi:hypothetical protein